MIIRTAVEARSLIELLETGNQRLQWVQHRALTELLREQGILIWTSTGDSQALLASLKRYPSSPKIKELWAHTLKTLQDTGRMRHLDPKLQDVLTTACERRPLPAELSGKIDLIVLSDHLITHHGYSEQGHGREADGPELSAIDVISECEVVQRARRIRDTDRYAKGADRAQVWEELFRTPTELSQEVALLDRYLLSSLKEAYPRLDHVRWLLDRLEEDCRPNTALKVLCAKEDGWTAGWLRPELERLLGLPRLNLSVEFVLAPWKKWRGRTKVKGPHDRHIRFSCGVAMPVEEGFDRLEHATLRDNFSWKFLPIGEFDERLPDEEYVLTHPEKLRISFPCSRESSPSTSCGRP